VCGCGGCSRGGGGQTGFGISCPCRVHTILSSRSLPPSLPPSFSSSQTVLIIFAAVLFIVDILFQDFQFVFDPDPNVRTHTPPSLPPSLPLSVDQSVHAQYMMRFLCRVILPSFNCDQALLSITHPLPPSLPPSLPVPNRTGAARPTLNTKHGAHGERGK